MSGLSGVARRGEAMREVVWAGVGVGIAVLVLWGAFEILHT